MPIRHIVMWNYKSGFTNAENMANACKVKKEMEALVGIIPGIISLKVIIEALNTSNRSVVMNSLFTSEKTLAEYQIHPEHVRVSNYIGTVMMNRTCIDYLEEA